MCHMWDIFLDTEETKSDLFIIWFIVHLESENVLFRNGSLLSL